ncbi:FAD/FMN-containing dehydrogenase [Corynebacterium deserti GIMN1.010]|uniref:Delta(24)-sterol reductase n=1 Tax=Corynebacterium deserti GIMN1.010 TaxID=931089 RepID=A0A0M4CH32_9CORY|nr:FAD-binding oxidoreductase [Corynebacterium deserti]ALC05046.1 FAD/FMN-containing dehydrogenase [Corynebacterium deserti GIMN1.010]
MSVKVDPNGAFLKSIGRLTNSLSIGRGIDQKAITPVGWAAHADAIATLQASFNDIPPGQCVRLAKKTSNLFRGRSSSSHGLDVSSLGGVIAIDPDNCTADVQGMCTYEDLVDATLPYGLMPLVVPQLKTITLGGAVTGMGVESTSFRNGLPHESVLEMDILTGTGEIVTCSPTVNSDLFRGFPNSYGSLGYAVRLKIELEPVLDKVALRHVRFDDLASLTDALAQISESHEFEGTPVDYLDGVVFSPTEGYLVLGTQSAAPGPTSDYTGDRSYYRSLQHPTGILTDRLSIRDYIWRWDTDWFWCSRAFGTQNPVVRRFWPRDLLRSSFYWKIIGWDRKYSIADRLEARKGRPARERVVQDVEVDVSKLPEFLSWFFDACEIEPVWLCPIRLRSQESGSDVSAGGSSDDSAFPWPLYPLKADTTWVNIGFWSSVPVDLMGKNAPQGAFNKEIERVVATLGGHKSLYSEAFYSREDFEKLYGGHAPELLKQKWDPYKRFPGLYEKTVKGA